MEQTARETTDGQIVALLNVHLPYRASHGSELGRPYSTIILRRSDRVQQSRGVREQYFDYHPLLFQ